MTDKGASALHTPTRESDPSNNNAQQYNNNRPNANNSNTAQTQDGGGQPSEGGAGTGNTTKNGVASGSCLAGPENPKTVTRKNLSMTGNDVIVHFDERVVVHTVPYWDPCGETYYDDDDEQTRGGPNCCIIL